MDPDQTAPVGSTLFGEEASKTLQQTTKQTTFVVIADNLCKQFGPRSGLIVFLN